MDFVDLIIKKRDNKKLSKDEINYFIKGVTDGTIPDYQISSMLMAIYLNGMDIEETSQLTMAMTNSGKTLDLSSIKGIKVDKHSTGGVGDTTTLVLAPLTASLGLPVIKMSGRGLGHTGGTLDKLESIPNFNVSLSEEQAFLQVEKNGIALMSQTSDLAPADKSLYALRDVTGTVENISLIASSIMSKKLAAGSDAIVLDVKFGNGAFMKNIDDAEKLATTMIGIGKHLGKNITAFLTNMNEPLGMHIGNSLEVIEAIETLKGNGPKDFVLLCETLGSYMLVLAKVAKDFDEGLSMIRDAINSGKALEKLRVFIENQGGNKNVVDDYTLLPQASKIVPIKANKSGYISKIEAEEVGIAAMILGAGRETKEDLLDLSAGIVLEKKVGDYVNEGDILAYMHLNKEEKFEQAKERFINAYSIVEEKVEPKKLIYGVVTKNEVKKF